MEETKNNPNLAPDGLIDPNSIVPKQANLKQVKEVKYFEDGLIERTETKVIINDGRELL